MYRDDISVFKQKCIELTYHGTAQLDYIITSPDFRLTLWRRIFFFNFSTPAYKM